MAQVAPGQSPDAKILSGGAAEKVIEVTINCSQEPRRSEFTKQHDGLHSHESLQRHPVLAEGGAYRYLDWDTPLQDLYTDPDRLPSEVTAPVDPFQWRQSHKSWVLVLCCASTFLAAYTPGAYTSGLEQMGREWGVGRVPLVGGVTTYSTGFAIAPMLLAPLSEVRLRQLFTSRSMPRFCTR